MSVMRLPFAADIAIVGFGVNTKKTEKNQCKKKKFLPLPRRCGSEPVGHLLWWSDCQAVSPEDNDDDDNAYHDHNDDHHDDNDNY